MQEVILKTAKRSLKGKALKGLRKDGFTPGVVYGQGKEATAIQVESKLLEKIYQQVGSSKVIGLEIEGETPKNVLFHDVQHDALSNHIIHFDLYNVRMDVKIKTEVPLHFLGEAPAVHALGALLLKPLESIEVEALPKDLPESIEIDISELDEIDKAIYVKDLAVPESVTILSEPEEMIVKVEAAREEEEEEPEAEVSEEEAVAAVGSEHGAAEASEGETPDSEADAKKPKEAQESSKEKS